jgi:hypothetical protein
MGCELSGSGEPAELSGLPTLYGPRSVCRDRLQCYGRAPPLKVTRQTRFRFAVPTNEIDRPCPDGRSQNSFTT